MVIADYVEMALPDWKAMVIDNGYDAILQIGLVKPKLVLLDIMMPEIDGFKVFERLSEMDELKSTRVIFVTAATDDAVLDRARNSGAFALIQKPLNREILTETLQRAAAESVST
jgi:putative two-component system response regulator